MKILTVSASPYLLSKLGKINSCLLQHFRSQGHTVSTASWHHDKSYFLAEDDSKFYFETDSRVCQIHPVDYDVTKSVKQVYEVIKKFEADVVLSIGDYYETDFIHGIKSIYPTLFKWVSILTTNASPIEPFHRDSLESIDEAIVTTTDGMSELRRMLVTSVVYANPGYDTDVFYPDIIHDDQLTIVANLKNAHSSNLPAFLHAMKNLENWGIDFKAFLHTNLYDKGDYDIRRMVKEFEVEKVVCLPEMFCSLQEGPDDAYLRRLYSKSHIVVDPSMRSASAMNVLEAMACGCMPFVSNVGALKDVVNQTGVGCLLDGNRFVGERHQEMQVISDIGLADMISCHWHDTKAQKNANIREYSREISQRFSRKAFVLEVDKAIGRTVGSKQPVLAVDMLI